MTLHAYHDWRPTLWQIELLPDNRLYVAVVRCTRCKRAFHTTDYTLYPCGNCNNDHVYAHAANGKCCLSPTTYRPVTEYPCD